MKNIEGRIGILTAMENEIRALLSRAEVERTDTIGGVTFYVGKMCGRDVVIAQAGVGKVLSAAGASTMLNQYDVKALIFTGVAGGVGDETRVLDMVIATELVQYDYGFRKEDGFHWSRPIFTSNPGTGHFICDTDLAESAWNAAVSVVGREHTFRGTIVSGDQFVSSESFVRELQENFGAVACEMEGAAVASVCEQYGVPFVVIRSMSDKADGKAHETILNMMDLAAEHCCRVLTKMLEDMGKEAGQA